LWHAINATGTIMIPDARTDVRFQDNPLVIGKPTIVFAGAPLISKDVFIGTICVIDHKT
jgi:GAF domain-containing protein